MKSLNNRMKLSKNDKQYYYNLKKGYEGEVLFDSYLDNLQCDCLILNDLLFKINKNTFQIDSLILMSEMIYLFEVKNFEGDYIYKLESNQIIPKSREIEIQNPLIQLQRTESLLRQLLQSLGIKIPINSSVVFVNPTFTLYQAPINKPFILPTQIIRYIKQIETKPTRITNNQKFLADKLISLHRNESDYSQIPTYGYNELEKGITCEKCYSFLVYIEGHRCICKECGNIESASLSIIRSVKEFKLLFPERKITTNEIFEWCKVIGSKKRILRVLESNFKLVGKNRGAYFE